MTAGPSPTVPSEVLPKIALTRGSGTALWRQIAEYLIVDITQQRYGSGERLPTEQALAAQFSVNRHTIRQTIAHLVDEGLLRVEQGRGTFVQGHLIDYQIGRRTRFSANMAAQQREIGGRLLTISEQPADRAVAEALAIRRGTVVIVIERLNVADGRPLNVSSHHFQKSRVPGMAAAYRQCLSISAALALCGVSDFTRAVTRVTAQVARAEDARLLEQSIKRPILVSEGINLDPAGRPLEFTVTRWASDRTQFVFEPQFILEPPVGA